MSNDNVRTQGLSRGVLRVAGAEGTANGSALAGSKLSPVLTRQQRHPSARRKAQGSECCKGASFVAAMLDRTHQLEADTSTFIHQVSCIIITHQPPQLEKSLIDPARPPNAVALQSWGSRLEPSGDVEDAG